MGETSILQQAAVSSLSSLQQEYDMTLNEREREHARKSAARRPQTVTSRDPPGDGTFAAMQRAPKWARSDLASTGIIALQSAGIRVLTNRMERRRWNAAEAPRHEATMVLAKWEGQVLTVGQSVFQASLTDVSRGDISETAEFSISELNPDERELVRPGAIFYWYIFFHQQANGKRDKISRVWFRRRGRMSADAYKKSFKEVVEIWDTFGWSSSGSEGGATNG